MQTPRSTRLLLEFLLLASNLPHALAADIEAVRKETLHSYDGPIVPGVDTRSLHAKALCGYQGWFNAEGDGAGRGFTHWVKGPSPIPAPGNIRVDLWPDLSEFPADERFATQLKYKDGKPGEVFSSFNRQTVLRHFQWMRSAGIDGVLVQRFVGGLQNPIVLRHTNTVLSHCREGAHRTGRTYAVEYDLSGLREGSIDRVIDDWKSLRGQMHLGEDPAYLHHGGKPVVEVWGIGFNDGRKYTLDECRKLVKFLREDGCCVICGVPTGWRTLNRDAVADKALLEVVRLAHIVSPWTVGRYGTLDEVAKHAEKCWVPDLAWCRGNSIEYMPVVFPGFSWHNQHAGRLDQIPRLQGKFLWKQFCEVKRSGAKMVNVAMFDEVDEGTAIFKCLNDLPTANGAELLGFDGLPSNFYLNLVGRGGRLMRGEMRESDGM